MYLLGARKSPTTASEIKELLSLHLQNQIPKNISDCLRKNPALVTPAEKGPPLKWKLTDKGLDRLRTLSGLSLSEASNDESFGCDIGIVCALETPELSAVIKAFGGQSCFNEVGDARHTHVYRECKFKTEAGAELRVVATTSTSMGLTAAAIATTQLLMQFRPRLVAMIGIAAGTRNGGKEFGDVLVADPSVDYASGKVVASGGIREFQPDPYPIGLNPRLRAVLQKYRSNEDIFSRIRTKWRGSLPSRANRIYVGPVGAADQVIDDSSRILEIQKNWRKLIGVEMETYGVYRAVHEAPDPKPRVVSFKAVCDFAAEKSDSWQDYAAFVAAEFAYEFLRKEWSSLWPK